MALQLILGGSGSGKSQALYNKIIEASIQHPEKNYIIVVPEQFTMQTQKELVRLHPRHGILNIDILSFQRLAYRVFEETGAPSRVLLTETGKNLLIRRVAAQLEPELELLGSRLSKPGYISEIKSLLSELTQYGITPGELEEMIRLAEKKPQLQYKLKDIKLLYQGFRDYQANRFITAEETMELFCREIPHSQKLAESTLAFDGFTGFTPVQQNAMRELLVRVPEILITVTLDRSENMIGAWQEHELFSLSKKTIHILMELARDTGTELKEPQLLSGIPGRFPAGGELQFLEQNLFRYGKGRRYRRQDENVLSAGAAPAFDSHGATDASVPDGAAAGFAFSAASVSVPRRISTGQEIFLHSSRNPVGEARFAARTIRRLVQEEGYRYREIAVITGDLTAYGNYVKKIFEEYEIPVFVDRTLQIMLNPCLELVRGVLGVVDYGFSYESMFRLLRTGLFGVSPEETDRLENYVLAMGIRGESRWREPWMGKTFSMAEEEPAACEMLRQRIMERLTPFLKTMKEKEASLQEYTGSLYDLMTACRLQEQLQAYEARFTREGELEKAKEYSQIYGIVLQILDEAVELLGTETVSRKEFEEILEAGFAEARVGLIPPGIDQVHVGDMERTRLNHIKVLFFLGLNDGWIPSKEGRGGIVSELEREFLQEAGVELAPTARQNSYIQRFYLYLGLTKPEERLYLSFCRSSSDGAAMRPSYLIQTVQRMFPDCVLQEDGEADNPLQQITSYQTGLPYLAEGLRSIRQEPGGGWEQQWLELLQQYLAEPSWREKAEALLEAAFAVFGRERLGSDTASLLYGRVLENSVTRLEQFASCAFAHFAEYGLGLKEREEYSVRSLDLGNIFHQALELFSKKLECSEYNWFTVPEDVRDTWMEQCVQETAENYGAHIFFSSARNAYLVERMKRILRRSIWALHEQVKAGSFIPSSFEVSFSAAEDLSSVNIALSDKEKMHLRGRIDRIDRKEEGDAVYVKVVDYKSGNTSFDLVSLYYGLQLQLVVYLNAALEMEKRIHPDKKIIPAGIFYYRMKDPMLDGSGKRTPEEINGEILKKLKVDGLINEDPEVIRGMDAEFEKNSAVIPVGRKADGHFTAASSVASREQLEQLSCFVQEKLQSLGKSILSGEAGADPYERKKQTACDYCEFSDICGFDPRLPGSAFRRLKELEPEEIWEKIASGRDRDKEAES